MDKELIGILKTMSETLAALKDVNVSQGQKAISGTPDAQLMFGPGGLFSNFGLDNTVINASMAPIGIDRAIPAFGTVYLNPIYPFITGFESDGGDEPDGPCDDAPGGVMEVCHQTAAFGRFARSSKEMEVNTLMQILNGQLTTDLRVLGSVLGDGHQLLTSESTDSATFVQSVVQTQLVIVGIELQRLLARKLWSGNPVNNTNGGYAEFPGLEMLISTGKVDAFTGIACAALDPDVKNFNYNSVDSNNPDILEYISMMYYFLSHVASRSGLDPVQWVLAMRPQLFHELTAVWPCKYLTDRCEKTVGGQATSLSVINDSVNVEMRDAMRNGSFLTVNGVRIPVITDDGITEENNITNANLQAGEYSSDIYFLPIRAKNMPTLYWEYLDYTRAVAELPVLRNKGQFWATDGGRYMWAMQNLNYCFKFQGKIEPRVVLRTPQLAGRIQNVKYSPLQHLREPFDDSPYFQKGGKETFDTPPSFYSEWNPEGNGENHLD